MRIKKYKKNFYILTKDNFWVRDSSNGFAFDINSFSKNDYKIFLENELENYNNKYTNISSEQISYDTVVIASDGFDFLNKQNLLYDVKKEIPIFCVNGALNKWNLVGNNAPKKRSIQYYVINNPFAESLNFLPKNHKYYPKCIASSRTNPIFLNKYQGLKFIYTPAKDQFYSGPSFNSEFNIDDYRNPICASINLAVKFGARKIILFCCDESFKENRSGSIELNENLRCYPEQLISHNIIDANAFWIKKNNIEIFDHSSGIKYENISYINETEFLNTLGK